MVHPVLSDEEIGQIGQEIYHQHLQAKVENEENIGKIVCIDIATGDYEVDLSGMEAARRLHARHPGAAVFGVRIGYNAVYSLGGMLTRTKHE